eukprot:scaffold296696_cov31-Prasinocladus_malaysianus.AAC.1
MPPAMRRVETVAPLHAPRLPNHDICTVCLVMRLATLIVLFRDDIGNHKVSPNRQQHTSSHNGLTLLTS